MAGERRRLGRAWPLVIGVLLVTMPAVTLLVAYAALTATQSVIVGQLTAVEAIELYLVEFAAFATFSYLFYRLTVDSVEERREAADEWDAHEKPASEGRGTNNPETKRQDSS